MIDKSRRKRGPKDIIPAFTPVPRQTTRFDGWTAERQLGFIEALADTGSVKAAAHAVNMTPEGAYLLRRHPEGGEFRKAWEAALALGVQQLEDLAMERAIHGQQVPVYSYGKLVGTRTIYNDRLMMFILRNRAPTRFTADGRVAARRNTIGDPQEANRLSRYRKKWRKEWEEEQKQAQATDSQRVCDEIDAMLDRQRLNWIWNMTPRTRAAYETYLRIEAEEEGEPWEGLPAPPPGWTPDPEDDDGEDACEDAEFEELDRRAAEEPRLGQPRIGQPRIGVRKI